MPIQENKIFLDLTLCNQAVSAESPPATTDVIDLQITKVSNCEYAVVGGNICYTTTIVNNSDVDFVDGEMGGIIFRDPLTSNLEYVLGSFEYTIGSEPPVQDDPVVDPITNVLTYDSLEIPAGETAVVTFCVKVVSVPTPPAP